MCLSPRESLSQEKKIWEACVTYLYSFPECIEPPFWSPAFLPVFINKIIEQYCYLFSYSVFC